MSPRQLLIVAHGSRREASNQEVLELAWQVAELVQDQFDRVAVSFLELARPALGEGLRACVATGAREIVVLPYFLAAGQHVERDIPDVLDAFRADHPAVDLRLARHLGASPGMARAIRDMAAGA